MQESKLRQSVQRKRIRESFIDKYVRVVKEFEDYLRCEEHLLRADDATPPDSPTLRSQVRKRQEGSWEGVASGQIQRQFPARIPRDEIKWIKRISA